MLAACSAPGATGSGESGGTGEARSAVTLIVHDSFPGEAFETAASAATGYDVRVVTAGDGGQLSSKLVLTAGVPVADAFFGVDNTFATRLIDHQAIDPYTPAPLPAGARAHSVDATGALGGEGTLALTAVDRGATCINIDTAWFAEHGLPEPASYDDLADPRYRGLTVLLDPTASSTGASFLVGTVAKFGDPGFAAYWQRLAANDVRIAQGWGEAYNGLFTQGGGSGTFPIVLSYATSPAFTVNAAGDATTTRALEATCSSQVEYAGVLAGASNPDGARAVVDYLLSREFQDTIADSMYMLPIDEGAFVPADWQRFAPSPEHPNDLPPAVIATGLDGWLRTWAG